VVVQQRTSWGSSCFLGIAAIALAGAAGCLGDPSDGSDAVRVTAALDNRVDPDEGKACYQDVPMRKGKMELGRCCFDDPTAGTSECVACDKEHHCTVGGAEPGALTSGGAVVWGGVGGGVLDPGTTTPPRIVLKAATSANRTFTTQP
jgi:hypothetical protein